MKKLLLTLGIGILGITGLQAQDPLITDDDNNVRIEQTKDENDAYVEASEPVAKATIQKNDQPTTATNTSPEKSKGGKAINAVGHGAKETGKGVKNGASWTWNKTKHNKLTKNIFNQPGDEDYAKANRKDVTQETKDTAEKGAHDVKKGAQKTGNEIDKAI